MSAVIDMVGRQFGRLTVVGRDGSNHIGKARWTCRCACGNERSYNGNTLRFTKMVSCGCLKAERIAADSYSHGHTVGRVHSPEYAAWSNMLRRVKDVREKNARIYLRRGITVCERWRDSFEAFFADMGHRPGPGYSIDRIDNEKGYEPGNCRWATAKEQRANQRPREQWAA